MVKLHGQKYCMLSQSAVTRNNVSPIRHLSLKKSLSTNRFKKHYFREHLMYGRIILLYDLLL